MKKFPLVFLLLLNTCLSAQNITVIESESEISFNFIDDDVDGTMGGFEFTGDIDLDNLQSSKFSGAVETKSLDTDNWLRSRHLRARKYFNAKDYPKLTFNSTSVSGSKQGFRVSGMLEIKGIEKQVSWNFSNDGQKLVGTTQINTKDYDISIYTKKERNEVKVTISMPYRAN